MSSSIFFDNKELKALRNLLNSLDLDTNDTLEELRIYLTETYKNPFPSPDRPDFTVIADEYTYGIEDDEHEFAVLYSATHCDFIDPLNTI